VKSVAVALGMSLLLSACSGLRGRAQSLYEKGAFREAVETFELAVKENPQDEEAHAGLGKARTSFIDKRLIDARMANLSGNALVALDTLLEVATAERQWNYVPGGKLGGTQEEESTEALRFLEKETASAIKRERPLWALYLLSHYAPVFTGSHSAAFNALQNQVNKKGARQCGELSKLEAKDKPFFSLFVRKVCTAWGNPNTGGKAAAERNRELFRQVHVTSRVHGLSKEFTAIFKTKLERALEQTPWFSPQGRSTLELVLEGNFSESLNKIPERRVHGYSVKEPYTDYENVEKTVITRNGQKKYTERQPITRFRDVPRTQPYNGWLVQQWLEVHIESPLQLSSQSRTLRLEDRFSAEGFEHQWNLPDIGLRPQTAEVKDSREWVSDQAAKLSDSLVQTAKELWEQEFCAPVASEPTLIATGERVHRCLRGTLENPPLFASQWYERFFGLTAAQANELLSLNEL
jgi:hypothetical protein